MNDAEVKSRLRLAGIPSDTFATTLVKEGLVDLRQYVVAGGHTDKRIAYLYPQISRTSVYSHKLDLGFYLLAKELVLSGKRVFCCNLVDIHTALFKETEEAEMLDERLGPVGKNEFIAIRGFHDLHGKVEQFMTPYEAAYFSSWLIRRHQDGGGFILQGAAPLMEAVDWWPASFLGYMRGRSVSFEVPK